MWQKLNVKFNLKKKTGQYAIINFPMRENHFQIQRVIRAYYEPSAPRLYRLLWKLGRWHEIEKKKVSLSATAGSKLVFLD